MRIRLLYVTGSFHGLDNVQHGQIVDIDEFNALRYIKMGVAEPVEEHTEESAVLTPKVETATVKRRGRPKKKPEWHDEHAPGWSEVKQQQ
jgi:hypothetical protein